MNENVYSNDELKELLTTVIEDCTRGLPGQILCLKVKWIKLFL